MICECIFSALIGSYHAINTKEYNAFNPGLIVEHKESQIVGMAYLNSYKRGSVGVGYRHGLFTINHNPVSIIPYLVTGYRVPVLATFHYKHGNNNFLFSPPIPGRQFVIAYARSF